MVLARRRWLAKQKVKVNELIEMVKFNMYLPTFQKTNVAK